MAEPRPRTYRAPAYRRTRHHSTEIQPVDFFENLLKVVQRTLRTCVGFAAPCLADQADLAPYILPVQIKPVSMRVLGGGGPAVQLTQENMGEGFGHRSRRALEQIADANPYRAAVQPNVAVRIREAFVLEFDRRHGRSRSYLAVNALENCRGRLEEQRTFNIYGRERITQGLLTIHHNI